MAEVRLQRLKARKCDPAGKSDLKRTLSSRELRGLKPLFDGSPSMCDFFGSLLGLLRQRLGAAFG